VNGEDRQVTSQIIRARDRYHHETDWLSTYWHFSFDHYHDPRNVSFGPLRVFNDDTVQPGTGFPPHSHADMEIISYVIAGALEHRDNRGNRGVIRADEVQVMSAGTGITHAEYNASMTEPVHFLQMWILPRQRGRPPRWDQRSFAESKRAGRLVPVVSGGAGRSGDGELTIDQDATIYIGTLETGDVVLHGSAPGRRVYGFVIDGGVRVNGDTLETGDQARIMGADGLEITALRATHLLVIDLP
jgi:redox-sensitive bicupin YhaK (pirin superfamily)